jgi:hypothetical protein
MEPTAAEQLRDALAMLEHVADELAKWPRHPKMAELIESIHRHLEDPAARLRRLHESHRSAVSYTPSGKVALQAQLRGEFLYLSLPPSGADEAALLRQVRAGMMLELQHAGG